MLGAFGTIRGKMMAVVVVSVVIAMGLAAYAMGLAPGLALQSARPLVEAGGAGTRNPSGYCCWPTSGRCAGVWRCPGWRIR